MSKYSARMQAEAARSPRGREGGKFRGQAGQGRAGAWAGEAGTAVPQYRCDNVTLIRRSRFPGRVERTPPVCRSALCSRLLSPFGLESVTVFDPAPLCASPSQKPACGFPAQASSTSSSPHGVHGDQRPGTWEWMSRGIAPETFPCETAPLAAMIKPFEQEFVDCSFKAV